jgi:hypothetical protein
MIDIVTRQPAVDAGWFGKEKQGEQYQNGY